MDEIEQIRRQARRAAMGARARALEAAREVEQALARSAEQLRISRRAIARADTIIRRHRDARVSSGPDSDNGR